MGLELHIVLDDEQAKVLLAAAAASGRPLHEYVLAKAEKCAKADLQGLLSPDDSTEEFRNRKSTSNATLASVGILASRLLERGRPTKR